MLELKVVYSIRVVSYSPLSGIFGMPTSNLNKFMFVNEARNMTLQIPF